MYLQGAGLGGQSAQLRVMAMRTMWLGSLRQQRGPDLFVGNRAYELDLLRVRRPLTKLGPVGAAAVGRRRARDKQRHHQSLHAGKYALRCWHLLTPDSRGGHIAHNWANGC
eukprot:scaffold47554_cov35-Phaeocystis_antarctica.AAC.2